MSFFLKVTVKVSPLLQQPHDVFEGANLFVLLQVFFLNDLLSMSPIITYFTGLFFFEKRWDGTCYVFTDMGFDDFNLIREKLIIYSYIISYSWALQQKERQERELNLC